ncbi:hypothetical protein N7507_010056 [Penicillium longicatenatum]|nr:hypothetical protein N7507_010056 [Penicillium longicatenatum]
MLELKREKRELMAKMRSLAGTIKNTENEPNIKSCDADSSDDEDWELSTPKYVFLKRARLVENFYRSKVENYNEDKLLARRSTSRVGGVIVLIRNSTAKVISHRYSHRNPCLLKKTTLFVVISSTLIYVIYTTESVITRRLAAIFPDLLVSPGFWPTPTINTSTISRLNYVISPECHSLALAVVHPETRLRSQRLGKAPKHPPPLSIST